MNNALRNNLAVLLREAGRAHHEAFAATDGEDEDWPIWYAGYLLEPLDQQLDLKFYKSQLIYCLMDADFEHQARTPESSWSDFFADQFAERYAPSENPAGDKLALYHFYGCPFCSLVTSAIKNLGIEVELRDIFGDPQARDDLVNARGRATVPVLRITTPGGEERWMPESKDIVRYLETTFS